jgi:hypothetical protein
MSPLNFRETRLYLFLEVLGKLLVPATLASLLANAFGLRAQYTAILAVSVVALTALALFRHRLVSASGYALFVTGVFVGVVFAWLALPIADAWATWKGQLVTGISKCNMDDACVARAVSLPHPSPDAHQRDQLAADLRVGDTLMHIPRVSAVLDRYLGIKETFLGTGITQPLGSDDYGAARIAEFLVPNVEDTLPKVLTWRLAPVALNLDRTLASVVDTVDPTPPRKDMAEWRNAIHQRLDNSDQLPAVVRLGQFAAANHSRRLGRPEAVRVFTLHLGQVWNMTLKDAARFSGYTLRSSANSETGTLFVWVFVPEHPDEVTQATWKNVVSKFQYWIKP